MPDRIHLDVSRSSDGDAGDHAAVQGVRLPSDIDLAMFARDQRVSFVLVDSPKGDKAAQVTVEAMVD